MDNKENKKSKIPHQIVTTLILDFSCQQNHKTIKPHYALS